MGNMFGHESSLRVRHSKPTATTELHADCLFGQRFEPLLDVTAEGVAVGAEGFAFCRDNFALAGQFQRLFHEAHDLFGGLAFFGFQGFALFSESRQFHIQLLLLSKQSFLVGLELHSRLWFANRNRTQRGRGGLVRCLYANRASPRR